MNFWILRNYIQLGQNLMLLYLAADLDLAKVTTVRDLEGAKSRLSLKASCFSDQSSFSIPQRLIAKSWLCHAELISDDGGDESKGREYDYVEDWGEQLVGKSQTVIVRLALDTGKVDVIARKSFGVEKDNPNVHKVREKSQLFNTLQTGHTGKQSCLVGRANFFGDLRPFDFPKNWAKT